jgi:hypothetical protein
VQGRTVEELLSLVMEVKMIGGRVFLEAQVVDTLGPPRADAVVPNKIGWDFGCPRGIDPEGAPVEPERPWTINLSALARVRGGGAPWVPQAVSRAHHAPRAPRSCATTRRSVERPNTPPSLSSLAGNPCSLSAEILAALWRRGVDRGDKPCGGRTGTQ